MGGREKACISNRPYYPRAHLYVYIYVWSTAFWVAFISIILVSASILHFLEKRSALLFSLSLIYSLEFEAICSARF
jgi:hypothetical protein